MAGKKFSFIGLPINDLYELLNTPKSIVNAQKAKLIPIYKLGDEMALTSVFLSSLKLIKEFRKLISSNINLSNSGKLHIFTEMDFTEHGKRVDGVIFIERSGKIVDAVLLEMKNKKNPLDVNQINDYIEVANTYGFTKLITVSNEFVSHPTQSPVLKTKPKKVELYHLSWSFILTIAHILLTDNDTNIADEDQVEIMKEVVDYFEHEKSGVCGFTEMKNGWKNISDRINKRATIKKNDPDVVEAVESWLQEEKDMALILSRELGTLVKTGSPKYKDNLKARIADEVGAFAEYKYLESVLKISHTASDITVRANFVHRSIEYSTNMQAPQDISTIRGQVGYIKKQIKRMESKAPDLYSKIQDKILISLKFKNIKGDEKTTIARLDEIAENHKDKYLREYGVVLVIDMGADFSSKRISIKRIEESLLDYYQGVVQHLTKWQKPAPEIKNRDLVEIGDVE